MGLIANGHSGDLVLNIGSHFLKFGKRNAEQYAKMVDKVPLPYRYPKVGLWKGVLSIENLTRAPYSARPLHEKAVFDVTKLIAYMDPLMKKQFDANPAWMKKLETMPKAIRAYFVGNMLCREDLELPMGYCHGDFTLENLFYGNGIIWAIDPIKGYIESPVMDYIKIRQDLVYGWDAHRGYGLPQAWLDVHMALSQFYKPKTLLKLDAMNIARIYPYGNKRTKDWCWKALHQVSRAWNKL